MTPLRPIVKHKKRHSDIDAIQEIRENPYMQYMLGLTEYSDKPIFDPSLFVTIRKRITIEDINALTLALAKRSEAKKGKKDRDDEPGKTHHTDIKMDATCADAEVKYLTDCGLLGSYIQNIQAGLSGKQHQGKAAEDGRMLDRHVLPRQ